MQVSDDEASRLQEMFKDSSFRSLFEDYMKEMQSPESRREMELYLDQMERQTGLATQPNVPEGQMLCRPDAAICFKFTAAGGAKDVQTSLPAGQWSGKVFANVCTSDLVDKIVLPTGSNKSVSLPFSLSSVRLWKNERLLCLLTPFRNLIFNAQETSSVWSTIGSFTLTRFRNGMHHSPLYVRNTH